MNGTLFRDCTQPGFLFAAEFAAHFDFPINPIDKRVFGFTIGTVICVDTVVPEPNDDPPEVPSFAAGV
jgi:hypothetical protein